MRLAAQERRGESQRAFGLFSYPKGGPKLSDITFAPSAFRQRSGNIMCVLLRKKEGAKAKGPSGRGAAVGAPLGNILLSAKPGRSSRLSCPSFSHSHVVFGKADDAFAPTGQRRKALPRCFRQSRRCFCPYGATTQYVTPEGATLSAKVSFANLSKANLCRKQRVSLSRFVLATPRRGGS